VTLGLSFCDELDLVKVGEVGSLGETLSVRRIVVVVLYLVTIPFKPRPIYLFHLFFSVFHLLYSLSLILIYHQVNSGMSSNGCFL
jgi:hypothetical protein